MAEEESFAKSLFFGVVAESLAFPYPALARAEADLVLGKMDDVRKLFDRDSSSPRLPEHSSPRLPDPSSPRLPDTSAPEVAAKGSLPDEMRRGLRALGAFGFSVPKAYGGEGLSVTASTRILQEIASYRTAAAVSLNVHQSLAARAILAFGSEEQKKEYLPTMASGEHVGAFCLAETAAGSDAGGIKTHAKKSGDTYRVSGIKNYVINGAEADTFVVFARTSLAEDGAKPRLSAFVVPRSERTRHGQPMAKHGMPDLHVVDLVLNDVDLPASSLLGEPGKGFRIATDVLNNGRLGLAACCLGNMKRLVRSCTDRVQERKAFLRSISEFALIKDKIALMAAEVFALESTLYLVTGLADRGSPDRPVVDVSVECAMLKIMASESYFKVANEAMQIMAGAGYMVPNFAEKHVRDARFFLVYQGTSETLRCFVALSGMQAPGEKITEVSRALREPIKGFGLLGDFAVRKAKSAFGRERLSLAHPAVSREANIVEEYAQALARNVDKVLRRHEKNIVEMQFTQRRVADMAIDLVALSACVSRVTRAIEKRGEEGSRREMDLLSIFAAGVERRLVAAVAAFDKNDDELRKSVADRTYADRGYPLDVI
jgi:acyl-CoA dehydrogenase family protein 9